MSFKRSNSSKKKSPVFLVVVLFILVFFSFSITDSHAKLKPLKLPRYMKLCDENIKQTSDLNERLEIRYYAYLRDEAQMLLWMKRTKRFFPIIEEILEKNGLPDDLKYMTVVESALIQRSYSPKGAVGLWQFMKGTARMQGLKVNSRYDERRDVYRATEAACRYLKFLHNKFGNWPLAMAAYNIGENRVAREVKEQGTDNFFDMVFPRETDEYVINVIIVKHIMEHPKRYDLEIMEEEYFKPFDFTEVEVNVDTYRKPVSVIAKAAGATIREVKELNPQIVGNFLFGGKYKVRIPAGGENGFAKRFAKLMEEYEDSSKFVKVVKKKAALRAGPGTEYKKYKMVKRGTKFKYISTSSALLYKKPWYEIEVKNKSYWVWSGLVTILD